MELLVWLLVLLWSHSRMCSIFTSAQNRAESRSEHSWFGFDPIFLSQKSGMVWVAAQPLTHCTLPAVHNNSYRGDYSHRQDCSMEWGCAEKGAEWLISVGHHTLGSAAGTRTSCVEEARSMSVSSAAALAPADQSWRLQSNGERCEKGARNRTEASTCDGKRWHYFSWPTCTSDISKMTVNLSLSIWGETRWKL